MPNYPWLYYAEKEYLITWKNTAVSFRVLVAGATGGVGQLTVGKLLEKGATVRVLTRSSQKAQKMFENRVEIALGDTRYPDTLSQAMADITHIICCTGTTAFPSQRWDFDISSSGNPIEQFLEWSQIYFNSEYRLSKAKNSPEKVDREGVSNLVAAAPSHLQRFVFVSSCGIERREKFPFSLLNAFGVLDAKLKGEQAIIRSQLPYTIIRPGRLIDGPYTSYDLNTLLKANTGGKLGIAIATGDTLSGDSSRIDVAAACVESLYHPRTERKVFELINKGPRPAVIDWGSLFAQL
ncbi:SDR family oxidoreductase [Planktothrix sp. FACHB-1355]|uniref:SDR family oxidoreductase n=1 Tax=Aerosakkonema funiforme FACHB-1375 TaxID=2949571 RepID=A0A926VCF9_9CYAN|nr:MULTISPECIES: SDR family oxidoreductase [Oscillatoriales]MBD2181339.1 SDR family oxidoreductase [Aerosakkonema funiforme FACHB-1375]MBD3557561.1 SDR family oxidoreductase [Planktothrix sp. FACHB-1355]